MFSLTVEEYVLRRVAPEFHEHAGITPPTINFLIMLAIDLIAPMEADRWTRFE